MSANQPHASEAATTEFPCPNCGGPTVPPTPGTDEQGYYCEVDGAAYDRPARYVSIVFMDGDEGREVVDALTNTEGVLVHGPTERTLAEAVEHLSQWDNGEDEESKTTAEPAWGPHDHIAYVGGYILAWNTGLGYVSLNRKDA